MFDTLFPVQELLRTSSARTILGNFWTEVFQGQDQVLRYGDAVGIRLQQIALDLQTFLRGLDRHTVPVTRTQQWVRLVLRQSQRAGLPLLADAGLAADTGLAADQTTVAVTYPLSPEIVGAAGVSDGLDQPTFLWFPDSDFRIHSRFSRIEFRQDPFLLNPGQPILVDGQVHDRELELWLADASLPNPDAADRVFALLREPATTDPDDLAAANAVLDAIVSGTARETMDALLAAVSGSLRAAGVVREVLRDQHGLRIVTDARVLTFHRDASPQVRRDDSLAGRSPVTDFEIHELNRRQIPASLPAITLPAVLLGPDYAAGITFHNRRVPVQVTTVAGRARVAWELGGREADIVRFWDDVHSRGLAVEKTLGNWLDARADGTEPDAARLPKEINPLEFLVQHVLGNNAIVLVVLAPPGHAERLRWLRWLRVVVPPETAYFLVIRIAAAPATLRASGNDTSRIQPIRSQTAVLRVAEQRTGRASIYNRNC